MWGIVFALGLAQAAELPVLKPAPEFSLKQPDGKMLGLRELQGKVWVADFIFTRCQGQCPLLSNKMAELQKQFAGKAEFRSVSFSVDPKHDSPQVLGQYAKRFGADLGRWFFLTGKPGEVQALSEKGFVLAASGGDAIAHSYRFVLVDKKGQIRGYYLVTDPDKWNELKAAIAALF